MDSFIRYEDTLLLEYNRESDYYWISYDSGTFFPYELYEYINVDGIEYYIIYLEDRDAIPTSGKDVWIALEQVLDFVAQYKSESEEGTEKMRDLQIILKKAIPEL